GEKGFDDYTLRVGLVEPGTQRLNWWEKMTAADWVKKLFSLAPPSTGIGRIHFFNVGTDATQIGRKRMYSRDGLMEQMVVAVPDADGNFTFTNHFDKPLRVIAVWVSCDGDDTHSSFAVTIRQVAFATATNASPF
ncbi:MAG TPA: hypothetical protein VKA67_05505, partial [Verrucomicrobiae bacterium]|nr:hypothetical protein [Verrucomicrobiae bacterium]